MSDVADLRRDLQRLLDSTEPLQHAVGAFGKQVALDQFDRDLGSDRMFSGFARPVKLGAGYDLGTPVVLNLRPAGLVILADRGRRRTRKIRPRRARALLTPYGWRMSSTSRPSRGFSTISTIEQRIGAGIVNAAQRGIGVMVEVAGF